MKQRKIGRRVQVLFLAAILLASAACFRTSKQTELMRKTKATELTTAQLRLQVHGFADHFSGAVEWAADEIIDGSDDRDIQRTAVLWKANATLAVQRASFHYDPLAALVDVWALCEQQKDFFETGAGLGLFADQQEIAVHASRRLVRDIAELGQDISRKGDVEEFKGKLEKWSEDNTIQTIAFARPSPRPLMSTWVKGQARGTGAVMGSLDEGISDLSSRLAIYAETMPKQARWQAELLIDEVLTSEDVQDSLANVNALADSLERTANGVETLPDDVLERVEPVLAVIGDEREAVTRFADVQRRAVQEFVRAERVAVVAAIRLERQETLESIKEEREDTLDRLDTLVLAAMDQAKSDVAEIIDHTLWRAAVLFGGLLGLLGILGIVALRVLVVGPLRSRAAG